MLLTYRFRLYPSQAQEQKLFAALDLCRWLYNRMLSELNLAWEKGIKLTHSDTQAIIVDLKRHQRPELCGVYSKVLQMVNWQLWSNIRALAGLKRNGKKVGRLRFKGGGFKTLNFNQSGFRLDGANLCCLRLAEFPSSSTARSREKSRAL